MRHRLAVVILVPFLLFTAWVLADFGLMGFFRSATDDGASQQVFLDLAVSLSMLLVFLREDANRHGVVFWPWVVLTLAVGSIGPLLYFVYTGWLGPTSGDAEHT